MDIVSIDLGNVKSVVYRLASDGYRRIATSERAIQELLTEWKPRRVVVEIGARAGRVHDVVKAMGIEVQVANPSHEAWRWRNLRCKTDRRDARKLSELSVANSGNSRGRCGGSRVGSMRLRRQTSEWRCCGRSPGSVRDWRRR